MIWNEPRLRVQGVTKAYDDVNVLTGIDLEVRRGEVMGLVGANGVGKSTLAGIIGGLQEADTGTITIDGGPWAPDRVCVIEQEISIDPSLTVADSLFRNRPDMLPDERVKAARPWLATSGLPLLPFDVIGDLRDNERRLLEVLRMRADPRDVIIMDELSNTLNAREVAELREVLGHTRDEERAVIYITHRLEEALSLCDRVAVIRGGVVVDVFRSITTTVEQLSSAIFAEEVEATGRRQTNARDGLLMSVRNLACTPEPMSFDLAEGEVVGVIGTRNSGVDELIGALSGEKPAKAESWLMSGQPIAINSPLDLISLQIAVLSAPNSEGAEDQFARNMLLLEDGDADLEASFESTAAILKMMQEAEAAVAALLGKSTLSGGQRRWQQVREIVTENARLVILIEPTVGLDRATKERFTELLGELTGRGGSAILVSSDEAELHALSDRILVVADGGLRAQWNPFDVGVEELKEVSYGNWPPNPMPVIAATHEPEENAPAKKQPTSAVNEAAGKSTKKKNLEKEPSI